MSEMPRIVLLLAGRHWTTLYCEHAGLAQEFAVSWVAEKEDRSGAQLYHGD